MRPVPPKTASRAETRRCTRQRRARTGVCHEHGCKSVVLNRRWEEVSRSRLTGAGFKPPSAAAFKRRGGERLGKGITRCQVRIEKMSESEPSRTHRYYLKALPKLGLTSCSRTSRGGTCLRSRWQSVYRRHQLNTGFGMERENLVTDAKGNYKWQKP